MMTLFPKLIILLFPNFRKPKFGKGFFTGSFRFGVCKED